MMDRGNNVELHDNAWARRGYFALGGIATVCGIIGALLPVMPTTCFLLVALWAFSKSSIRFHSWLWNHKRFGPPLRRWQEHRQIPRNAKIAALASMSASLLYVVLVSQLRGPVLLVVGGFLLLSGLLVYRIPTPSKVPAPARRDLALPCRDLP